MPEVHFFAAAREAAGTESTTLDVPTLGAARIALEAQFPALVPVLEVSSFLSDGIAVTDPEDVLGARLDVLPPFAGG